MIAATAAYNNDFAFIISFSFSYRHFPSLRRPDLRFLPGQDFGTGLPDRKRASPRYPKDSKLITTLLRVYQEETGDTQTPIIASGGGTYAKEADNIVAFGMEYPGYDPHMHGVNECTGIRHLVESMGIYAHAIIELGKLI